jgi:trichothecene 3-O-acetyltransferase
MDLEDSVFISGPSFHVDLAALDARHPIHYSRRLLIFHCTSTEQRETQLAAFKTGVQALVARCPVLGGVVVPLSPAQARNGNEDWRTIVPDRGIEVVVRDLKTKLPSFGELETANFPPSKLPYELLVPVPQDLSRDRPFAACKMQFSAIDGGTILTFAMSHSVADGSGTNELMRILSEETRLAQELDKTKSNETPQESTTPKIGLDRTRLRNMTNKVSFDIRDHPGFVEDIAPPQEPIPTHDFQARSREIGVLLHIPPSALLQLKADAMSPDSRPTSTHDALSALIWRTVLLIRSRRAVKSGMATDHMYSISGNFYMPSDARRHVGLPESYIGNVVYQLTAALQIGDLVSPSSGLQHAASAIRQSIASVTADLVASYIAQTREKWVHWRFLTDFSTTGVAMGTDWTSGCLYKDDWGKAFGPLVRFRYPGEAFNCIFPKLPDGGAEVLVSVMPEEVPQLHGMEGFGKYLESI